MENPAASFSKGNILIVDDTPENLSLLSDILEMKDYGVRTAANGQSGINEAKSNLPDLILLDIMMPDLDGFKVCAQLKSDPTTRDIPVIFLSALSEIADKVRAFGVGGVDYITKPFQMQEVLARVDAHVSVYKLRKSLEERNAQLQQEIAERMRVEDELSAQNAELDAFAHSVAHDLKNPLTSLIGFAELLQTHYSQMPPDFVLDRLAAISRNGKRMVNIINALLLLSSVRQMSDVALSPLDMRVIVAEVVGRLEAQVQASEAQVKLPESWPVVIGYAPWVEEVWANYLSNALKYGGTPPRIELGSDACLKNQYRFWVRDFGVGIDPEEQSRLFTPFTRLTQLSGVEGHGLGLSIVQRIIEKMGGQVGVESKLGEGSLFYFTLPCP